MLLTLIWVGGDFTSLGPVTKLDKGNKTTSKVWRWRHVGKLWLHCYFSDLWPILGNPETGFRTRIYESYIFINNNLLSYKNWKQNLKISNTALTPLLWVKVLFLLKNADFLQKNADISKIKRVLVLKGIFSETKFVCVLTYQISSF